MTDQEKQLFQNLANLCAGSRLTADEHKYFENGLQYLAEKVEAAAKAAPAAPSEKPALAAVPSSEAPSEA